MERGAYEEILRKNLTPKRYRHSICVGRAAGMLAERFGGNREKAELAGILHDITKDMPQEKQLKILEEDGIILSEIERSCEKLWHAKSGAAYLKKELQITDPEILDAVCYHTTGRKGMRLLDKILFLADFISEDRDFEGVALVREATGQGLDFAVGKAIAFTIFEVVGKNSRLHPDTVDAWNDWIGLSVCRRG